MELENVSNFSKINIRLHTILQKLSENSPEDNIFISPTSIFLAMALLTEGLSGETRAQCQDFFGFDPQEVITKSDMDNIKRIFSLKSKTSSISLANSTWVNKSCQIKPDYKMRITGFYEALIENLDFSDPKSVEIINSFVEEKTSGMIKNVVKDLKVDEVLLLVNTIFFSGPWKKAFKPCNEVKVFWTSEEEKIEVEFIKQSMIGGYFEDDDTVYFSLDYKSSGGICFLAAVPKNGFKPLESFDMGLVSEVLANRTKILVTMPKFDFECNFELKEVLKSLGLEKIFMASDDFKGIMDENIVVSQVVHKTKISVDEKGTKAAAATVVRMLKGKARKGAKAPPNIVVDRPFAFFLVDMDTELVLFSGVTKNPL